MISMEAVAQGINLVFTCVFAVAIYFAVFQRYGEDEDLERRPHKIYLIWIGLIFLSVGLLGGYLFEKSIVEGFLLTYHGYGSMGFCLFYGCCVAGLFEALRVFVAWLVHHLANRKEHDKNL
jgi:FtsH-binding integral membrane protein